MKWLRFTMASSTQAQFGCLDGDTVIVHKGNMFNAPQPTGERLPLAAVHYLAPCLPTKMLALWNNFQAAAQKNNWAQPTEPLYFVKPANTFSAHKAFVDKPKSYTGRVLFEAELGIVIGKTGKNITLAQADEFIFGYTCVNDVTALEILRADASFEQWTRAKGFDGFAPFGPFIETQVMASALVVKGLVNSRERQNYPVADMFFSPQQLVSLMSRDMTLNPGDVISCGTSLGAAPWQADAQVEVVIDGVGTLLNTLQVRE
jgi:2-keto-4-pentenoate hydratase/2-oxohepta-3-ene-1,7-dioic acid hydratase in catechol pathway